MKRRAVLALALARLLTACGGGGTSVGSSIQITSSNDFAGAIGSLIWAGVEFIDAKDHGRLLQSAVQFDGLSEADNPTEAGSSADTLKSSSVLLSRVTEPDHLQTATQMAYWLPYQGQTLSSHVLRKDVRISGNAIRYETRFEMPAGEAHGEAQYEALTAYMPLAFSRMCALQTDGALLELARPGVGKWTEQDRPLVFSTADGSSAMGVRTDDVGAIYGNWDFADCVKWNLMFRIKNPQDMTFVQWLVVGTVEQVRYGLHSLQAG